MAGVPCWAAVLAHLSVLSVLPLASAGKYSLVAPKSAIAGTKFNALLYTYSVVNGSQVNITVSGNGVQNLYQSSAVVNSDSTTNITVQIGTNWPAGTYQLTAAAQDGSFSGSTVFTLIQKSLSIFIQTDKAIYKPAQPVRIRVLVTTPDLKPYSTAINVLVQDPSSHKIMQWTQQPLTMGVVQLVLPLSDQPPLGVWTVTVTAARQGYSTTFEVAEYTLPRFSVSVLAPSYITADQTNFSGTIQALYTYKEMVQGKAHITFSIADRKLSQDIVINGKATFNLLSADLVKLGVVSSAFSNLAIEANVTEALTGITQSGSASVPVSQYAATVTFMSETSDYYKSGLGYTAYIQVSQPDGSLLIESNLQLFVQAYTSTYEYVTVTPSYGKVAAAQLWGTYVQKKVNITSSTIGVQANGIATFQMSVPTWQTSSFIIQATLVYKGQSISSTKNVNRFSVSGSNNIRIQTYGPTNTLKSGDKIRLLVSVLQPPKEYFYIVTARGRIVAHSIFPIQSSAFDLVLTPEYAPQATFLVYANGLDGEIVSDSVTLNVNGALQNKVGAFFQDNRTAVNTSEAQPAQPVTLQVCSDPTSVVFVLAVDQSVLLLKGGNDITNDKVLAELTSYVADSSSGPGNLIPFSFFGPRWGGSSSTQVFTDAGLSIATDSSLASGFFPYPILWDQKIPGMPLAAAGPMVGGAAPVSMAKQSQATSGSTLRTRTYFPETWLWDFCVVSSTGCCSITQNAPDTITTYLTTAFSINANSGLAVKSSPTEFTVFQPFFVTAIVPYSLVRGEQFALSVIVFNYLNLQQNVTVTLSGSTDFDASLSGVNYGISPKNLSTNVVVSSGAGSNVQFWIRPRVLGEIALVISAISQQGADKIQQLLLVQPEGIQQSYCLSEFLLLQTQKQYNNSFAITYPPNVVSGSKIVDVRASGDIMSASIQGLDQLVQVPSGCGEQNMITFSPNVFVRRYIDAVSLQDAALVEKTQNNMIIGYQRELTYLRTDNLFSAFGNSDAAGSTWLTAFVLKCFRQAQPYLESCIDPAILVAAKSKLLQDRRVTNGSFVELGHVIHADMQGGSGSGITLTAFVIIALLENNPSNSTDLATIKTSVTLLENSLPGLNKNIYALAIVTYALTLSGSQKAQQAVYMLKSLATLDGDTVYWSKGTSAPSASYCAYCPMSTGPSDVEMTSYALLTYVYQQDFVTASQIVKWLAKKRSSLGGYSSTQDTVLALQSLAAYASAVRSSEQSLKITYTPDTSEVLPPMLISFSNSLIQQTIQISQPDSLKAISVMANGYGSAIVSVCVTYNVLEIPATPTIDAKVTVHQDLSSSPTAVVEACAKSNGSQSGMWIMELMSPSCFVVECNRIGPNKANRIDCIDNSIVFYYYEFTNLWTCVNTSMQQLCNVRNLSATYAKVYPYYQPARNKLISYNINMRNAQISTASPAHTTIRTTSTTKRGSTVTPSTYKDVTTKTVTKTTVRLTSAGSSSRVTQTPSTVKKSTASLTTRASKATTTKRNKRVG